MKDLDHKLNVLRDIAHVSNRANIVWAVGASALLFFKGKTNFFNDIDIMVAENSIENAKQQLLKMGLLAEQKDNRGYKTKHFYEFNIQSVDVDVMAGLVIVNDGVDYPCPFSSKQIEEYINLNGEKIPLQSLSDWKMYYHLMGRAEKASLI